MEELNTIIELLKYIFISNIFIIIFQIIQIALIETKKDHFKLF